MREPMTDLELTRLCAEAMGLEWTGPHPRWGTNVKRGMLEFKFNPLHDDAQAMALEDWLAERGTVIFEYGDVFEFYDKEPEPSKRFLFSRPCPDKQARRRAIVECVAKMQEVKSCVS